MYHHLLETQLPTVDRGVHAWQSWLAALLWTVLPGGHCIAAWNALFHDGINQFFMKAKDNRGYGKPLDRTIPPLLVSLVMVGVYIVPLHHQPR